MSAVQDRRHQRAIEIRGMAFDDDDHHHEKKGCINEITH